MSKSVARRRNRRAKALGFVLEYLEQNGTVSCEEINRQLGLRNVKSSTQYVGLLLRDLVKDGSLERVRLPGNRAAYRISNEK